MVLNNKRNISKRDIFRITVGMAILMSLMMSDVLGSTVQWSDTSRHFRLPVVIGAAGFDRFEKPVEMGTNFTQILNELGQTGTLDDNSIHIVETDSSGTIINNAVQFQFNKDWNYNSANKASGTIVFIMDGITQASQSRYYYIYFDLIGGSYSPISVTQQVTLTDNIIDEGWSSYKINIVGSTYYFQKQAGGFSSWADASGNDWIGWSLATGSAGEYRGIPNAVYGTGQFHPGFNCCTSNIVSQGPIKIRIRSVTNDGRWESIWDFYPRYATMTMTRAGDNYWFLYEGTPGGALNPNTDFMMKSDGIKTMLSQSWYGDIANNEWTYFSDPDVGRSLFLAHHEDDNIQDMYRTLSYPTGSASMTIFGFGRSDSPVSSLMSAVPQHFTIGLIDGTDFTQNSKIIKSAYKDLIITKGIAEQNNDRTKGDVNDDGQITSTDALLYLRHSVGQNIYPFKITVDDDVACDGKITTADALKVLRKAVGQPIDLNTCP